MPRTPRARRRVLRPAQKSPRKPPAKPAPKRPPRRPPAPADAAFSPATVRDQETLLRELHRLYPDADCELAWRTPLDLVVATILSAQSTDQRVNQVTADLFRRYRTAADYARAKPEQFEREIHSTGFYRQKTKHVLGAARRLVEDFGGRVPATMAELLTLPGVARKTANVVLGTAFGSAVGVVVDTHVKRLAFRLGLSASTEPEHIEQELMERLPRSEWIFAGHAVIWHGRRVCSALRPACDRCTLRPTCPRNGLSPLPDRPVENARFS